MIKTPITFRRWACRNRSYLTGPGEKSVGWVMIPCDVYSNHKPDHLWLKAPMGRDGTGDTTSSSNVGEEYQTSERMINAAFVYVLHRHSQLSMPCQLRKAGLFLKEGKAKIVRMAPFAIASLGDDAGTQHTDIPATTEQTISFEAEAKLRTDFQEALAKRQQSRRSRRNRIHQRQHKVTIRRGRKRQHYTAPKIIHGNRLFNAVGDQGQMCFVFDRRSTEYFDLRTLDEKKISTGASRKKSALVRVAKNQRWFRKHSLY